MGRMGSTVAGDSFSSDYPQNVAHTLNFDVPILQSTLPTPFVFLPLLVIYRNLYSIVPYKSYGGVRWLQRWFTASGRIKSFGDALIPDENREDAIRRWGITTARGER